MKPDPSMFPALCVSFGLPRPEREVRFHPLRKWRWDYAFREAKIAVECDGGIWTRGKHSRGAGILRDQEKRNAGTVMGWKVLVFTPQTVCQPSTFTMLGELLHGNP
jgi:very-short-patch-repair endonuclease